MQAAAADGSQLLKAFQIPLGGHCIISNMNIKELKIILETKTCPKCGLGMVSEIRKGVYECTLSRCGEVFDFSAYADMSLDDISATLKS